MLESEAGGRKRPLDVVKRLAASRKNLAEEENLPMSSPVEPSNDKMKALEAARMQIEKQFGKGAIMKLGEEAGKNQIPTIPTGSILLDAALGVGG